MPKRVDDYKSTVLDPGDRASAMAKDICVGSYQNCPAVEVIPCQSGNFRGPVDFCWRQHILRDMLEGKVRQKVENDGAGGKPQFFTLVGTPKIFERMPWEIIEMTVEDTLRWGSFPAVMVNQVDCKSITEQNFPLIKATFNSFGAALKKIQVVNITGEIAVMKHSITAFCDDGSPEQFILTWSGACIGLSRPDRFLDGSAIQPDMPIVGFWEPGYRCNGGTFFTKLLLAKYGSVAGIRASTEAMAFVEELTTPSKNYSRTLTRLLGWNDDGSAQKPLANITGIAHITGGGIWGKLAGLLPQGVGALLGHMPEPAPVLRQAQEWSWDIPELRLSDRQAHGTLHGGCGMMVVCADEDSANRVITEATQDDIKAQEIGFTTESAESEIEIVSQFKEGWTLSSLDSDDSE